MAAAEESVTNHGRLMAWGWGKKKGEKKVYYKKKKKREI